MIGNGELDARQVTARRHLRNGVYRSRRLRHDIARHAVLCAKLRRHGFSDRFAGKLILLHAIHFRADLGTSFRPRRATADDHHESIRISGFFLHLRHRRITAGAFHRANFCRNVCREHPHGAGIHRRRDDGGKSRVAWD